MNNILKTINYKINNDLDIYCKNKKTDEEFLIGNIAEGGYKLYSLIDDTGASDYYISTEKLLKEYEIEC